MSQQIDLIINTIPVSDIARRYTNLKQRGGGFIGLSPFNDEKTPSFNIYAGDRRWKCFSSDKGGNVIDLLREKEGYSLPEAIGYLAEFGGIPLEDMPNFTPKAVPEMPHDFITSARKDGEVYICEDERRYKEFLLQGKKNVIVADSSKYGYMIKRLTWGHQQLLFVLVGDSFRFLLETGKELYALTDKMFIKVLHSEGKEPLVQHLKGRIDRSDKTEQEKQTATKKYIVPLVSTITCPMLREYNERLIE